jgi:catechol 2,3-dioxygenase-like lactoylglutathione lyase family enzyme
MTPSFYAVGVVVDDMPAALGFYRRLGLDIAVDADTEPHVEADLPGGLKLMFDTVSVIQSFDPGWTRPIGGHQVNLAFGCGTPSAVNERYAELVAAGYRGAVAPFDAFWGQRYATVLDPDGNGVDLFAPLDGA